MIVSMLFVSCPRPASLACASSIESARAIPPFAASAAVMTPRPPIAVAPHFVTLPSVERMRPRDLRSAPAAPPSISFSRCLPNPEALGRIVT